MAQQFSRVEKEFRQLKYDRRSVEYSGRQKSITTPCYGVA